jgi:hypothetical protein
MKGYYERNRQHILDYHKQYYRNKKKWNRTSSLSRLLEFYYPKVDTVILCIVSLTDVYLKLT